MEKLEFYRIQYLLKEFEDYVEKENEEYKKQQRDAEKQYKSQSMSQPNYGGFKIPKYEMPKYDIPKIPR